MSYSFEGGSRLSTGSTSGTALCKELREAEHHGCIKDAGLPRTPSEGDKKWGAQLYQQVLMTPEDTKKLKSGPRRQPCPIYTLFWMMSKISRSLWSEKADFPASHWESVVGETPNLDASHFFFLPVSVRYVFTWLWMDTDGSNCAASLRIKMFQEGVTFLP